MWNSDLLEPPEGSTPHGEGPSSAAVGSMPAEPGTDMFGGTGEWLTWNQLVPEEDVVASCWTQLIDVEQDDGRPKVLVRQQPTKQGWSAAQETPSVYVYGENVPDMYISGAGGRGNLGSAEQHSSQQHSS